MDAITLDCTLFDVSITLRLGRGVLHCQVVERGENGITRLLSTEVPAWELPALLEYIEAQDRPKELTMYAVQSATPSPLVCTVLERKLPPGNQVFSIGIERENIKLIGEEIDPLCSFLSAAIKHYAVPKPAYVARFGL